MTVYFIKGEGNNADRYICKSKGFKASYSISTYREYAKDLAELSDKTKVRYKNIYVQKKKYIIMKVRHRDELLDFKIDYDSIDLVSQYRWKVIGNNNGMYLIHRRKDTTSITLHRLIMGLDKGDDMKVDHKNRDTTDNRIKNLKIVTSIENNRNRTTPIINTSGFMGVSRCRNNWVGVGINEKGERISKSFSINKYGNDEAFEQAKKYRIAHTKHYERSKVIKIKKKCK